MPPRRALPRARDPPSRRGPLDAARRASRAARLGSSKIIYKIATERALSSRRSSRASSNLRASARDLKLERLRASRGLRGVVSFARLSFASSVRRVHHSAFTLARPLRAPFNPFSANPSCASTLARDARPGQCRVFVARVARAPLASRRVASSRRRARVADDRVDAPRPRSR